MKSLRVSIFAGALAFACCASIQAAPPSNDNFANAMVLSGQAVSSTPVTIDDATREGLEPANTGDKTVWYTWTAPADGIATITTDTTNVINTLSVYNGNAFSNLVRIGFGDDDDQGGQSITIFVKQNFVYQICVGSYNDESGTVEVNIVNKPTTITAPVVIASSAGANDNFANATALTGPVVTGFTYAEADTREGQEPSGTGDSTAWWFWTAPADAEVTINTSGIDFGPVLEVYNGNSLPYLTKVAGDIPYDSNLGSVSFPTKQGAVYYICLGGGDGVGNTSIVNVITAPLQITSPVVIESAAAANDNFANAQDLGSAAVVSGFGFNDDATTESLEPQMTGSNTLWWTWTAPQDGMLACSATGTDFDHRFLAYTGASLASLQSVAGATGSPSSPVTGNFAVTAGAVYHFVIGSNGGGTGTAVLNLNFSPGVSHVSIAAATPVVDRAYGKVKFILRRDGDISRDLIVNYTAKSSAGLGGGSASQTQTISAGNATAKFKGGFGLLSGYNSAKITVTVQPGSDYVVGSPAKAKVKIFEP